MIRELLRRRTRLARSAAALAVSASLVFESAPALAQRRSAEPEANPDFQNQAKPKGGGPIGDAGGAGGGGEAVSEPASPAASPGGDSGGGEEKLIEQRNVQSVQIGAAPEAKPAATATVAPLDTRVTVRVKGAPLATFLDTISAQAKVNFIITEGLEQKRVTAFLQNVTVREALQVLLEIKGLTYQQIGKSNTYVVTQRSKQAENLITRIYALSFVPLIPILPDEESGSNAQGGGAAPQMGGGGSSAAKPCTSKSGKIGIMRVVCTVLSRSGDIEIEPRTNSMIVTDIPEVFPQVEQIIAELDKKAPQVMIEAQIVEIDSTRTRDLGFEWGGANGELATFTGGSRDTTFPLNMPRNLANTHFFDPLNPTAGLISSLGSSGGSGSSSSSGSSGSSGSSTSGSATATNVFANNGYLKTSVLDLSQLRITLRALVSLSEARFLGKPKILTLNNKTATIEISQDQATDLSSTLSSGGGVGQSSVQVNRQKTGVTLKVTPQVNKEGYITMFLQPSFTDVQQSPLSSASQAVFDPVSRKASTMVRVKNGQTLVLAGLLRSTENKTVRKVPFLGYIPIVGWFFTNVQNSRVNSDLVIFITPTIVSD